MSDLQQETETHQRDHAATTATMEIQVQEREVTKSEVKKLKGEIYQWKMDDEALRRELAQVTEERDAALYGHDITKGQLTEHLRKADEDLANALAEVQRLEA